MSKQLKCTAERRWRPTRTLLKLAGLSLDMLLLLLLLAVVCGWQCRMKVRAVLCHAYHALFMLNMLIRPTKEELEQFGEPDFVIYNGGAFPANKVTLSPKHV